MSLGSSPTPCSWGLRQKGHLTWRVLADQQSTNAAGSASIIGIICAHWTGWTYKPLFWSIYRECQRTGAILSLFELLLISSPSHHSLGCWYLAPLDNLSTLTESVIDKVILEFVSNCATGVPLAGGAKTQRSFSFYSP